MLDEKDLQAIGKLMDEKLVQQKQDILGEVSGLMSQQKQDILSEVSERMIEEIAASERRMQVLMESYFTPQFNLLADGQQSIREQMVKKEDLTIKLEDIQAEMFLLRTAVKRNAQEIEKLKKAQ